MGYSLHCRHEPIPCLSNSLCGKVRKYGQRLPDAMRLHDHISEFEPFAFASTLVAEYPDDGVDQMSQTFEPQMNTPDGFEQMSQTFEPQVNTPALFSFLVIAIVFSLLQLRINQVREAATRRDDALKSLREIKAAQLGSPDDPNRPSDEYVRAAVTEYEKALNDELSLRTIIPGVRIVAPNDPKTKEKDIAAAKQFLGYDLNDDNRDINQSNIVDDPDERRKSLLMQPRKRFDGKVETSKLDEDGSEKGISNGAKAVLLVVAFSQIVLLAFLSFDPMTGSNSLNIT